MKILYAASEAQPVAASGGLADVAGSLPKALVEEGHEVGVVVPLYVNTIKQQWREKMTYVTNFSVPVGWRKQYCGLFTAQINGVTYYFLDNEYYFKRDFGLYGYYDDAERYAFFSRAVLEMLTVIDFKPQVINSNDWQCALIPVYYNMFYKHHHKLWGIKNVFTIHNIQYQGRYGMELLEDVLGIPKHFASLMEYDKDVNFMKAAIEVSDKVTTVSPTYAREILDPWYSHGLDRALRDKQYKTCGFLNGIDTDMYNPATDPVIPAHYTVNKKTGKKTCTQKLLEEVGLPGGEEPVLGMISRLVEHKGFDLVKRVFNDIINLGYKVVILGSGEAQYEQFFHEMRWSIKGFCRHRQDVRTFHLSRIRSAQILDEHFRADAAIIASVTPDQFLDYERVRDVTIRLNEAGRQFAAIHALHSAQSFTLGDDGFYTMFIPFVPLERLVPWVLRQQGDAMPLGPASVVRAVRVAVRRLADVCQA